jgi:p-cumate 2,3-dioxygenase alpha subunit
VLGAGHAVITFAGAPWARPVARRTPAMGEENRPDIEGRFASRQERFDPERAPAPAIP